MKYLIAVAALLAGSAVATPLAKLNARQRIARRNPIAARTDEYNTEWAGAVLKGRYTGVSASFAIPQTAVGTTGETTASSFVASSWIGLDGYNCANLWQAGVDATISKSTGEIEYYAWHEWYPAGTVPIDLGPLTAHDIIFINLTTSGPNKGTIFMENKTTGRSFTKTIVSEDTLCGVTAEWIVEDFFTSYPDLGLASFGNVTFSNAFATTKHGKFGPSGADLLDLRTAKGETLTETITTGHSITGQSVTDHSDTDHSVIIKYLDN
ncbi:hypothetical protein DSL72_005247 [Monilinia vaccinii-corymbosi]|uniref:Uncharacterized protein n=1 Tax=Monilinia vaccinii-corymbosi TaxID=61207 RepID=A0A8A3PF62_9HELO|nr:hypothetical protein DSL72_005247 [Monilinia vaccinii-corymbosi]